MSDIAKNLDSITISSIHEPQVEDLIVAREQNELLDDKLGNAKLNRFVVDTKLRTHLTYFFSIVISLWLAAVIAILFFNDHYLYLKLSDNVLIVLLTTTSINVIGMMLIILKNLFPQNIEQS